MAHTEECRGCSSENRCDFIRCTKEIEKEIRAKAIDEFEKKLFDESYEDYESDKLIIDYADVVLIAEQLKGGVE